MTGTRRPCIFRQRDVTKAVRAVAAAGKRISRVEVDRGGKITIVTAENSESTGETAVNEWDAI